MRNVLGVRDADHEETNPTATRLAITALACSLVGQRHPVKLTAGSRVHALYGADQVVEPFYCNYGVNPEYRSLLDDGGLAVTGIDDDGQVRVVERRDHPFFIATLYVPQARSSTEEPHPLIAAFVAAVHKG